MLVPPQGVSTCMLQDIVSAVRIDNYTTDWELLSNDDGEGMWRCQKIGCGFHSGTADFIAAPKSSAASVLAAAASKKGVFDITKHCSTCRDHNVQNN